jgi:hypothetical protein
MSQPIHGLYKAIGGFRKRERECCDGTLTCRMRGCNETSVGYVETVTGPQPICRGHIAGAERAGYTVHRGDQP